MTRNKSYVDLRSQTEHLAMIARDRGNEDRARRILGTGERYMANLRNSKEYKREQGGGSTPAELRKFERSVYMTPQASKAAKAGSAG